MKIGVRVAPPHGPPQACATRPAASPFWRSRPMLIGRAADSSPQTFASPLVPAAQSDEPADPAAPCPPRSSRNTTPLHASVLHSNTPIVPDEPDFLSNFRHPPAACRLEQPAAGGTTMYAGGWIAVSDRHNFGFLPPDLDEPVSLRVRPDRRRTLRGTPEINRRHDDPLALAALRGEDGPDGEQTRRRNPPSTS